MHTSPFFFKLCTQDSSSYSDSAYFLNSFKIKKKKLEEITNQRNNLKALLATLKKSLDPQNLLVSFVKL